MAQTLCIKCGSDLKASSYCQLCQEPLIFTCTSCNYITEEKVHTDCRNAEILAKTAAATTAEEGVVPASITANTTAAITPTPRFISTTTKSQQESIVNKPKEEVGIHNAELSSAPYYMTTNKQDNDPFVAYIEAWLSLMTYWLYIYGVSFKNALKTMEMTEEWYNMFCKTL